MERFIKFILIIVMVLQLTGCWNNRDLTELAIMTGVAIDKGEDGKIRLTVQVVQPQVLRPSDEGGGRNRNPFVNIESQGVTVFDAARNLLAKLNKKAYFGQVQLIVISEEAARNDISEYFDLFERDTETKRRANLLIAKGMDASKVLESQSRLTDLPSAHIAESVKANKSFGKSMSIRLIDVLRDFDKEHNEIVIPVVYSSKETGEVFQEELIREGAAVIKKGRLEGFLDPFQTRGFLFAKNDIKSTIINIPYPANIEKMVSIEVIRSNGKISAKMKNGKPELSIRVKAEGNIGEQQPKADLTKSDTIEAIEKEVQNEIEKEINDVLEITQQKYKSDVFGFINEIYKDYYSEWKDIVSDWQDIYSNTTVDVKAEFEIRTTGLINKPAEPK